MSMVWLIWEIRPCKWAKGSCDFRYGKEIDRHQEIRQRVQSDQEMIGHDWLIDRQIGIYFSQKLDKDGSTDHCSHHGDVDALSRKRSHSSNTSTRITSSFWDHAINGPPDVAWLSASTLRSKTILTYHSSSNYNTLQQVGFIVFANKFHSKYHFRWVEAFLAGFELVNK